MVFGTFDVLHPGHLNFFKQARKLAKRPFLIVSVARDANVKKIKSKDPLFNERKRLALVKKTPGVDKAVLSASTDYLGHILKHKPDIIALGYDQKAYTHRLRLDLWQRGFEPKIVRLKAFHPKKHKSSIYKRNML
jgi:FAD synthetase